MQLGAVWCSVVRLGAVWCSVVQCGAGPPGHVGAHALPASVWRSQVLTPKQHGGPERPEPAVVAYQLPVCESAVFTRPLDSCSSCQRWPFLGVPGHGMADISCVCPIDDSARSRELGLPVRSRLSSVLSCWAEAVFGAAGLRQCFELLGLGWLHRDKVSLHHSCWHTCVRMSAGGGPLHSQQQIKAVLCLCFETVLHG